MCCPAVVFSVEMAEGVKSLVMLAFAGSLGVMFLLLSCALPRFANWTPFSLVVFYAAVPLPYLWARKRSAGGVLEPASGASHVAAFVTGMLVVSTLALPVVLASAPHAAPTIASGACVLSTIGSLVVLVTIYCFFQVFDESRSMPF